MGAKQRSSKAAAEQNGSAESGQDLGSGVAALASKARLRGRLRGAKGRISDTADDVSGRVDDVTGSVQSAVSDTAERVQNVASDTVYDVSRRARKARKKARRAARKKQVRLGAAVVLGIFASGVATGAAIARKSD